MSSLPSKYDAQYAHYKGQNNANCNPINYDCLVSCNFNFVGYIGCYPVLFLYSGVIARLILFIVISNFILNSLVSYNRVYLKIHPLIIWATNDNSGGPLSVRVNGNVAMIRVETSSLVYNNPNQFAAL